MAGKKPRLITVKGIGIGVDDDGLIFFREEGLRADLVRYKKCDGCSGCLTSELARWPLGEPVNGELTALIKTQCRMPRTVTTSSQCPRASRFKELANIAAKRLEKILAMATS
jgi:hypothetical protein